MLCAGRVGHQRKVGHRSLRVVGLVGVCDCCGFQDALWRNLELAFAQRLPGCEFVVERRFFMPWQVAAVQDYGRVILSKYDDGRPALLIGFSLGGVVAQAVAEKFTKSEVVGVASLCSPLTWAGRWGLVWHPNRLVGRRLSVMGMFDFFVPWWMGRVKGMAFRLLAADHLVVFSVFPHVSRRVVRMVCQHFFI